MRLQVVPPEVAVFVWLAGLADERWNIDCMSIALLDKAYPFIVDCGGHTAQVSPGGDEATCPERT